LGVGMGNGAGNVRTLTYRGRDSCRNVLV